MGYFGKVIEDDDPLYFHKDYRIIKDPLSKKWGIKNVKTDVIIIKCIFDDIKWLKEEDMIEFTLNDKHALSRVIDIYTLTKS